MPKDTYQETTEIHELLLIMRFFLLKKTLSRIRLSQRSLSQAIPTSPCF